MTTYSKTQGQKNALARVIHFILNDLKELNLNTEDDFSIQNFHGFSFKITHEYTGILCGSLEIKNSNQYQVLQIFFTTKVFDFEASIMGYCDETNDPDWKQSILLLIENKEQSIALYKKK